MSLKGDRHELQVDMHFFCNAAGNRGGIVSVVTGGSGASMDQSLAIVSYVGAAANPALTSSGNLPIGMLLQDVVSIDQTRQHINWHRDEVQVGSKVAVGRKGYWVTDQVVSGTTPAAGQLAYLGPAGQVTPTISSTGGLVATPLVGRFLSAKDQDGYATVSVDL